MAAHNGRLRMKRWFGAPAPAMASMFAALPAAVLALLLESLWLAAPLAAAACACVAFALAAVALGEELVFVPVMLASRAERGNVSCELGP